MGKFKDEILKEMEKLLALKKLRQQATLLAAHLIPRLQLHPEGIDLILWLANSDCKTNREALIVWITEQIQDDEVLFEMNQKSELSVLTTLFGRKLDRIIAANDSGTSA